MLRWLSLALVLAASHATFTNPSLESKEPGNLDQCRGHAWVRAPDMVPGDVIAGDVKVKLIGPCTNAESYTLGLRYKERIFWKLRRQDAPLPEVPKFNWKHGPWIPNRDLFQVHVPIPNWTPEYNETEWMAYKESFQNKDSWSLHEEERVAFEIKTTFVSAEGAASLPLSFIAQFGILVPNTNYPPGLDYRQTGMVAHSQIEADTISSESTYDYFVEIKFSNGTTSEIPAEITASTPIYHLTESDATRVNLSLAHGYPGSNPDLALVDMLRSNYTIELSFPDGTRVYRNSSINMTAIVHRTGYTNRTDTPTELCAFLDRPSSVEWHPQELKDRSPSLRQFIDVLAPLKQGSRTPPVFHSVPQSPCRKIKFAAIPVDWTREGHISSTSSEPLSLSLYVGHHAVPDFSTYYHKLENRARLNLKIKPDPSEPWVKNDFMRKQWKEQTADMDETDFEWVPWSPAQTYPIFCQGNTSISVIPMQKQGHLRSTPVHYLSEEARQPERDFIAPLAQPYTKVYAEGEELRDRYFISGHGSIMKQPIYVGDTWAKKVAAEVEGQRGRDNMDHFFVVQ